MLKTLGTPNAPDSLIIFDNFKVDSKLPKFQKEQEEKRDRMSKERFSSSEGTFVTVGNISGSIDVSISVERPKPSRWQRFKLWWKKMLTPIPPPTEPQTPIPLIFEMVLTNEEELTVYDERHEALGKMLEAAKLTGQQVLLEKLEEEKNLRKFENMLFAMGRKKVLTEKQLLKFVRNCEKGLCLDWVANFTRPIPGEVVAEKVKCDSGMLFDNYVVLHYDPLNNSAEMTEQEKLEEERRRRDPILFGVVRGSRKLYFVGDWKDELCDLTLDEIIEKLDEPLEME